MKKAMRIITVVFLFLGISSPSYAAKAMDPIESPESNFTYYSCKQDRIEGTISKNVNCELQELQRLEDNLKESFKIIQKKKLNEEERIKIYQMKSNSLYYCSQLKELLLKCQSEKTKLDIEISSLIIHILRGIAVNMSNFADREY